MTHLGFALLTLIPDRMGGSETYVRGLLGEFAAGHGPARVSVLANRLVMLRYGDFEQGPVRLHRMRTYRPGRSPVTRAGAMTTAHLLPWITRRGLPRDLGVLHFPVTVPIPRSPLPQVVTLHDVQHHDMPSFFPQAERLLRKLTYDAAAKRATAVVTPSEYARRRIVEVLNIPPERVHAVPSGVDHRRFRPEPGENDEALARELRLERPYVLYPANLWPHKNHRRLVAAFAALEDPDLELVLLGRTYGRLAPVLAEAGRHGGNVRHLGYVGHEALPVLYRRARALVFPSLYEGFGGPPLEAMACGCPVASSTRASLAEVVGDAAAMLDPESVESIAEALKRVVSDEEARPRLRAAGLERARAFSWRVSAERHTAIYERVSATFSVPKR